MSVHVVFGRKFLGTKLALVGWLGRVSLHVTRQVGLGSEAFLAFRALVRFLLVFMVIQNVLLQTGAV